MATVDATSMTQGSGFVLDARGVSVKRGTATLLDGVDLSIKPSELVGLIGPNGAGKSTLLTVLAGLDSSHSGEVSLKGSSIGGYSTREKARLIGWMEQFASSHWPVSVEHLVTLGRLPYLSAWQKPSDEDRSMVTKAMIACDCDQLKNRRVDTLSGGEMTRVMLARVLAGDPSLLFADEPVAALDIGHQLQTMAVLRSFADAGKACVVVLHDLSLASQYCDRLYLLDQGQCVASGAPRDVLTKDNVRRVYGVEIDRAGPNNEHLFPVRRVDS